MTLLKDKVKETCLYFKDCSCSRSEDVGGRSWEFQCIKVRSVHEMTAEITRILLNPTYFYHILYLGCHCRNGTELPSGSR